MFNIFTSIMAACLLSTSSLQVECKEIENNNDNIMIIEESEDILTSETDQIVGYIDSTTTYSSCGCYGDSDQGNLTKVGGFLGIGRTDQAMYVSDEECGYEA